MVNKHGSLLIKILTILFQTHTLYILSKDNARLEQCPHNPNHFVPSASLEAHKVKCWYSSALGTEVDSEAVQKLVCGSNFYAGTNIARLEIGTVTTVYLCL